ncbi:GNAT family N-acetyltransferase [Kribbella sp. NPDC050281]|uniref:GNAT family N-acetyltransferase n=1 Tax=Kribbella sp. NPDC050281 TaxID=3155515 RepID=UPI0033C90C09
MELVVRGELVEVDGTVVGAARMRWWDEADGTRLYLLTGSVEPAWQGQGIGRRLLAWQEDRAREHAAADAGIGTPMFGGNPESERQLALLEAAGYRVAFTRVRMTMPLNAPTEVALPAGVELRPASAGDHRAVFEANADVFGRSSLGYVQDTFEEFETDVAEDFPKYALWTLAWDGDRLAGWVVSGVDDTPWVGVRPAWRRRGLASALLRSNHAGLWEYGVRTASLWTILENPTGSVALYESLGYRIAERQPRYRKPF